MTPRGVNMILQQLHLTEVKLRDVKENFDELLDLSVPLSQINKSLQRDVYMDLEPQKDRKAHTIALISKRPKKTSIMTTTKEIVSHDDSKEQSLAGKVCIIWKGSVTFYFLCRLLKVFGHD